MKKDVVGFEGYYEVTDKGEIFRKSEKKMKDRVALKHTINKSGYATVTLSKNGIKKTVFVHRIVMTAFRGISNLEVNHINENKLDNRLKNLEYVTHSENMIKKSILNMKRKGVLK